MAAAASSSSSLLSMPPPPLDEASTLPPAFFCPISLDLMTDPVTLSSGITYDRASIQCWFAAGNRTCPVTRQPLLPHDPFFIPNHTLLRIIRTWSLMSTHSHSHQQCMSDSTSTHCRPPTAPGEAASRIRQPESAGCIRVGRLCIDALFNLGLLDENDAMTADLLPHQQAPSLLISLLSHYGAAMCGGREKVLAEHICTDEELALAEHICEEAVAVLSMLPLSPHHLSSLSTPLLFHCLSRLLHSSHRHSAAVQLNSASLLAKLISQHPSPKPFLRSLSPASLSAIASGLVEFLKISTPSSFLGQLILHSLCLLCKSSHSALCSLTEATCTALAHAALGELRHSARQTNSVISDTALHLLKVLASCAEGRAAIASHAFAVPTIAKFLQRSSSEAAMESAVVVLWKLCRYSSEERVRRQAMAACAPSMLVLLMQASHCSERAKSKAGDLVRLLIAFDREGRPRAGTSAQCVR